ncbi:hypothetical protein [Spirochaeta isovalerica]|uniref:Uncharacterized protein n=1 Tax=Spirochaeta isovalerica TaxID=150 RepID=A0A841RE95_9SPIO|nr:hypothetical protein [Spirochaeta isovalerica]MBB6481537.1 hypothetical protein [Spirochaeta isovalerica]
MNILERKTTKIILFTLITIHIISMYIAPWFIGGFSWLYVQDVWDRWQGIIVGAFASITSYFIFLITRKHEDEKKKKALRSARSLLPKSLSYIYAYCRDCAPILSEVWYAISLSSDRPHRRLGTESKLPDFPIDHEHIFNKCIEYEDDEVISNHLISILIKLQINHSRISELTKADDSIIEIPHYILSVIYGLLELLAMINKTFEYARFRSNLISSKIEKTEIYTALANLNWDTGDFIVDEDNNLKSYIDAKIAKY